MRQVSFDLELIKKRIQNLKNQAGSEQQEMQNYRIACELCNDRGGFFTKRWNEELGYEYEAWIPCECSNQAKIRNLFKASRISEEFQAKSFDNFILTGRPSSVHGAYECAKTYAANFDSIKDTRKNSIAIMGRPGSGKTHLLMAVANYLIQHRVPVMYFPWVEALNNLKDDFSKLDERIRQMQTVPVLYIDDLFKGRKMPTEFQLEQLFAVVNDRYLNKRPMLISSEKMMDEIIDLDEGLGSRLAEMCMDYTVFMIGGRELNYRLREGA